MAAMDLLGRRSAPVKVCSPASPPHPPYNHNSRQSIASPFSRPPSTRPPSTRPLSTRPLSGRPAPCITSSSPPPPTPRSGTPNLQLYTSIEPLEIKSATFRSQETACQNHTERLRVTDSEVILRRGNTLILKITTSISLSCSYVVSLTFVPVFRPRDRFGQFRADGLAKNTCTLWLSINVPCGFPVGKYNAHISLSLKGGVGVITHFHNKTIVVLFNPWNKDDDSYVANEEERRSYLVEDVGVIWRGTASSNVPLRWEFGQYEENCLDVALYLLRSLTADECRSAVCVSRILISKINTRDNTGVLSGSSGGAHMGGMHPCRWSASTPILNKFHRTKAPVKFGQCWVFSGVAVTLLRALGIASRPVTCYNAAHYCQELGQVKRYFTPAGDLIHDIGKDQLWVYHVWCEAWMRRDDLGDRYGGWQVLDATSQDRQSGRYRIGPASVLAVKEGNTGRKWPYDVEFVKSEVGADVRYLRVCSTYSSVSQQAISLAHTSQSEVGNCIITSSSGLDQSHIPLNITARYRELPSPPEPLLTNSSHSFPSPMRDCSLQVNTTDGVKVGEELTITVVVQNNGAMLRTVDGKIAGTVIYYTGRPVRNFMTMQFSGLISPGQSASVSLPIDPKKYMRSLVEQSMIQFFIVVKVRESKQLFLKVHPYQLVQPSLLIQCPSTVTYGSVFHIKISFTNVLLSSLSRVLFLIQGQALCSQKEISHKRLVLPGRVASVGMPIRAHVSGTFVLLVTMYCDQLTDVRGQTQITVLPPPAIVSETVK